MVPKTNKILEELLASNEGNMKDALQLIFGNGDLANGLYSLGNLKLANHVHNRMRTIRIDSEALDDQKAGALQMGIMFSLHIKLACWKTDDLRTNFSDMFTINKRFPNASGKYPIGMFGDCCKRVMSCLAVVDGDWKTAESLISESSTNGKEKYAIWPQYSHHNMNSILTVYPTLALRENKLQKGENVSMYDSILKIYRDSLETYAKMISGTHRCSGVVRVAQITLALQDRPFGEMFSKLESALAYTNELDCFPLDVIDLELEIARWKADAKKFREVYDKCKKIGYNFHTETLKSTLEKLESGEMNPIDLSFVPDVIEPVLSDEEKLAKLKEDLKAAKQLVKVVGNDGTDDELDIARTKAKAIKREIKKLQKEMVEKAKPTVDQAKIDEIRSKIVEAQARQERAFDDDDDDAEEAATAEIKALKAQLKEVEAGNSSIPKQKLEDARKKDDEINK